MSCSPLHDKVHELLGALTFLVNHQNTNDFPEDIQQAKETIQKLLTELSQHLELGINICQFLDENPGLTE
jgi:hypothetical protein